MEIFNKAIEQYHKTDNVDVLIDNPYSKQSVEYLLFLKNSIDTVQWHLEDIIRKPNINALEALQIKRRIDKSNQDRTDLVELIDDYFFAEFKDIIKLPDAKINTETPAWAIDRLSILTLKIYHMYAETLRTEATTEHVDLCKQKLKVLKEQQTDLSTAIDQLLEDIASGKKYMKTYKQMKMYNDPNLNPELYNKN
jgi:predicted  nucleic acid-binding Zn-ribbon protein